VVRLGAVAVLIAGLTAAGCGTPSGGPPGVVSVVASTNVWADVVEQIAGRLAGHKVQVTSIITDPAADPHSYEANSRNKLAIYRADLIVENGGGYDDYVDTLRDSSGSDAPVINAVDVGATGSDNEHVWFDFPTVEKVARRVEAFLIAHDNAHDNAHARTFRSNTTAFVDELHHLEADEALIKKDLGGDGVAITEPVALYMLTACGLVNRTPTEFSEAVEEGTGLSPHVLSDTLSLFDDRRVGLLVYNRQTKGVETSQLRSKAAEDNIPEVGFSETLPPGKTYVSWMRANLAALVAAEGISQKLK
jgi:zinc/manganese transport system substrate-binding protein